MPTQAKFAASPPSISPRTPRRATSQGVASEGRYMPSRCAVITPEVIAPEWWSCTCMLIGVAVMMKLITA